MLLLSLLLFDITSSSFVNAAGTYSNSAAKLITLCNGGSINLEPTVIGDVSSNQGNGTTTTYECVMSSMNEHGKNNTILKPNDMSHTDSDVPPAFVVEKNGQEIETGNEKEEAIVVEDDVSK